MVKNLKVDKELLFLILGILSSTLVALTMKYSQIKCAPNGSMITVNYVVCILCALFNTGIGNLHIEKFSMGLGAFQGLLYLLSFLLYQYNIRKNGLALSSAFMKLGLLVPIIASIFWFREIPTIVQIVGILLAIAAILILNLKKDGDGSVFVLGLIFLLLTGGAGDFTAKIFEVYGQAQFNKQFVLYTFVMALILSLALAIKNKQTLDKNDIICGIFVGVPNYFSAYFLLKALYSVPATIAYPTYSMTVILLSTLAGVFLFKEKLSKLQLLALFIVLCAVVLLNI